jgi:hypothetical protein
VTLSDYPKAAQPPEDLEPRHEFFIGIDSDGCAFDTMEIKHSEGFIPNIIKHWGLQPVSKGAREAAEVDKLLPDLSPWRDCAMC